MEKEYIVLSDRYNHKHKFIKTTYTYLKNGILITDEDIYTFVPEQEWMPIYVTYTDSKHNDVAFIDTEGGPNIYSGWSNNEICVDDIILHNDKLYFKIHEC
jgi:hypothetical protein